MKLKLRDVVLNNYTEFNALFQLINQLRIKFAKFQGLRLTKIMLYVGRGGFMTELSEFELQNSLEVSTYISQPARDSQNANTSKIVEERKEFTSFSFLMITILFCCIVVSQLVISAMTRKEK